MGQTTSSGQNTTLLTAGHNHAGQLVSEDFVDHYQLFKVKLPFPDWMETGNALTRTKIKKPITIKRTSCGAAHMILRTNRLNDIYVVGKNSEFQLGLSHNKPVKELTKIDTNKFLLRNEKITNVFAGTLVSYLVAKKINPSTEEGDSIYWCGSPPLQNLYVHNSSSLGQESTSPTGISNNSQPISNFSFTRWSLEDGWKKNFRVKCFDCSRIGDDHCIVVNQFNQIFGRGSNAYHQYGRNIEGQNFDRMTEIKLKGYEKQPPNVKLVACGGFHSVVVLENNEFYCSGLNCHGQLGYDVEKTQYEFIEPPNLPFKGKEITDIALGLYHTVVVVEHSTVYVCGDGRYGQLGNGENKSINPIFTRLKLEAVSPVTGNFIRHMNTFITGVSCGLTHTVIITSDRKVWRCGGNDFGQIFLKNELQTCSFSVTFEPRCEINQVSCGGKFTALYLRKRVPSYAFNIERHLNIWQDKENMRSYSDTIVKCKRTSIFDLIKNPKYNLKNVEAPKLSGKLFLFFVNLVEFSPIGDLLVPLILKSSGFSILDEISVYNAPVLDPIPERGEEEQVDDLKHFTENGTLSCTEVQKNEISRLINEYFASELSKEQYVYNTIAHLHKLYLDKQITPLQVAKNILNSIKETDKQNPSLKAVIKYDEALLLRQAEESTKRYKEGKQISAFDGIPVTIKDELDLAGFTSSKGMKVTEYTDHIITEEEESNVSKSLRELGTIFVGKANQNEIGICARGINVNFGSARNPYNLRCDTGGSSSGSGAGVGSGMIPLSIGTDGGGSVRIPSSLCGIYGLKPTHFRISTKQKSAPVAFSTCVAGPMTGSAIDLTLAFAAVAGRRSNDPKSLTQPRNLRLSEIRLTDPNWYNLNGRKIGIHVDYFNDVKDSRIPKLCKEFIENVFCKVYNAQIDDSIAIPILETSRVSHLVTIAGEMRNGMKDYGYFEYEKRSKLCPETRMSLLSQKYISASSYITAQRVRSHQMEEFEKLFENVDVIALPTVGCVAPEFDEEQVKKGGLGVSDYDVLSSIMKFIFVSNFCGFPSVSIPIGFIDNKPVGLQLMAKWWDEVTLLKFCLLAEKYTEKKKPTKYIDVVAQQ